MAYKIARQATRYAEHSLAYDLFSKLRLQVANPFDPSMEEQSMISANLKNIKFGSSLQAWSGGCVFWLQALCQITRAESLLAPHDVTATSQALAHLTDADAALQRSLMHLRVRAIRRLSLSLFQVR